MRRLSWVFNMLAPIITKRADVKRAPKEKNVDTIPLLFQQIVNDPYIDNIELAACN
jgi:hypothetical protein